MDNNNFEYVGVTHDKPGSQPHLEKIPVNRPHPATKWPSYDQTKPWDVHDKIPQWKNMSGNWVKT